MKKNIFIYLEMLFVNRFLDKKILKITLLRGEKNFFRYLKSKILCSLAQKVKN